ncbi:MAG TPA: YhgE/Pip domain-containing protein, partial [Actinoplanes sp.]|nr:YhgE/Pip domain-containing protein [Actinoplanes sp.]
GAVSDDATNYLSGVFARTAFDEVRAAASARASAKYFDRMLIGFTDLKGQTGKAADGATDLRDGAGTAETGAGKLADGLDSADDGAGRLAAGLRQAGTGADDLADGLRQLNKGAGQLASGTAQAAAGGRKLASAVDAAADKAGPVLRDHAQTIEDAANLVADGADRLADHLGELDTAADRIGSDARELRGYLDGQPEALALTDRLVADAERVRSSLDSADLDTLRTRLRQVAKTARAVADAAPHLADDVAAARRQVDALADGLDQLATGAKRLKIGTADAAAGATELRGGVFRLASGARELDGGLATLSSGGHDLASGLGDLTDGAGRLADGLTDGAAEIPGYDDAAERSGVLADPVSLDRVVRHPAATYGVGFAPYFLALALWVGAMINYMLLRPLNRRYLMSGAPPLRVALAGLLPGVVMGVIQATLLYAVVHLVLGLNPVHGGVTWLLMAGTATVFAAILQLAGAALGPAGRVVALALLMLQLTSSGGTYPVQTSPDFFQTIHPLLPMTYVVEAVRHAIDGGTGSVVVHDTVVLASFGLGALLLTVLLAARKRRMRTADLHPELVL